MSTEEVNKPEDPDQEKPKKTPKNEEKKQVDQAGELKEPPKLVKKRFPIAEFLMSLPEEEQSAFGSKVVASYNDKSMSQASARWLIGQHIDQLIEKYKYKI